MAPCSRAARKPAAVTALRDLELANDRRDAGHCSDRVAGGVRVHGIVRPRDDDDPVRAVRLDPDRRDAARARDPGDVRRVDALLDEVVDRHARVDVVAERADHRDAGAEARRHHGLVRALATEAHDEPIADHGLAGPRHARGIRDQVDVHAADDGNRGGRVRFAHVDHCRTSGAQAGGWRRRVDWDGGAELVPIGRGPSGHGSVGRPSVGFGAMRPPKEGARATFGDRPKAPRPVLLTIVFGVLLAIVGVTATSQAVMVSVYASTSTLQANVESDLATIRGLRPSGSRPANRRRRTASAR